MLQPRLAGWRNEGSDRAFAHTPLAAGLPVAAYVMAGFLEAHVPPFVTSGPNLSDPAPASVHKISRLAPFQKLMAVASVRRWRHFGLLPQSFDAPASPICHPIAPQRRHRVSYAKVNNGSAL
jgi:hypothetical protein